MWNAPTVKGQVPPDTSKLLPSDAKQCSIRLSNKMTKKIVVFGATGNQGGSVVRAMGPDSNYTVYGVTRNPDSAKAKELKAKHGIEPIQADIGDAASVEAALQGAHGVFLVTNFLLHRDVDRDLKETANVVDAAKKNDVKHFVYSGLENVKEEMGVDCTHYDVKAKSEDYIKKSGVPFTFVHYSAYMENFSSILAPRKLGDGKFMVAIPTEDQPFDMIPATEAGEVTHQIINAGDEYKGKTVGISTDKRTVAEYCQILNEVFLPNTFVPGDMTTDKMRAMGGPLGSMAAMYDYWKTQKPKRDIQLTRKLHPGIPDFRRYMTNNKEDLLKIWNDPKPRGPPGGGPPGAGRGAPPK